MSDIEPELFLLRSANDDLVRRVALLEARLRERESVEPSLHEAEALSESTRMLTVLMGNLPGMVYRCLNDSDWTMIFVSEGALALTGYEPADLVANGRVAYAMLIHEDDRDHVWSTVQASLGAGEPFEAEYRILAADGQEKWVWERGRGVFTQDRHLRYLEGFVTDITERKRAEEALQERESLLRAVIDNMPFEFWARDREERCFMENAALVRHWGSLLGQRPEDSSVSMPDLALWKANNRRALAGEAVTGEVVYRVGGQLRVFQNIIAPIRAGDDIRGILGLNIDITERRLTEEALAAERAQLAERVEARTADLRLANAELARALQLKDEFLATMSHELRTPLNAILGFSELLQEALYGPITPEQRDMLRSIDASGQHLLALINEVLDLSRIEAGRLELRLEAVDVALVCQMSLHMVAQSAQTKQIALSSVIDPQVLTIVADERRLTQILVNLLANAVKFTPEGGQVGLEVSGDRAQQIATFAVWDTGIGIAEEHHAQLFQPFIQIDSGLNRQYAGTGLGLALVQRLARAHRGDVAMVSRLGEGSRFSVALPWCHEQVAVPFGQRETAPAPARPSGQARSERERWRILVADDNLANRRVVEEYLRFQGYEVVLARDGAEALEQIEAAPPDLVLMDIQMPSVDGLAAIRQIRGDSGTDGPPIIAMTALAMPGDRERCLAAGADTYLTKPISLRDLAATIEARLER